MNFKYSLNEVDDVAEKLLNQLDSKIILLNGEMGAGKTTLVKSIVKALGSDDEVNSPTYSIVNEYSIKDSVLYHFDMYRINDLEEAYNFGIEDYLYSGNWIIIEWPEIIRSILPNESVDVLISKLENNYRKISLVN